MWAAIKVTKYQTGSKFQQGRKHKGKIPISHFIERNKKFRQNIWFCRKKNSLPRTNRRPEHNH